LGVANIASDSHRKRHSGSQVKPVRHRYRRLRRNLQKKPTRAAKRRLRLLAGQERRFAAWVNHHIRKQIVAEAQRSGRGIAIEEWNGIRERVQAGQTRRAVLHEWVFSQLRLFLEDKSRPRGVPIVTVDPHHTSRTCCRGGHCEKKSRQSQFRCRACGHEGHADINAAVLRGTFFASSPYPL
jgi:IS605 OrfB family transposase